MTNPTPVPDDDANQVAAPSGTGVSPTTPTDPPRASDVEADDDGPTFATPEPPPPSCLPAIVAATLLMGIVAFITCGVSTWFLWQQRTVFAIRTLEGYGPVIEQSYLTPEDKQSVIEQLAATSKRMQTETFDPAAASAVMQRLVRLPIPQWGELAVIEEFAKSEMSDVESAEATRQLSRLRVAIEQDLATVIDVNHVLEPVTIPDTTSPLGRQLVQPLAIPGVREVISRASLIGDRSKIPPSAVPTMTIREILAARLRQAEAEGGF